MSINFNAKPPATLVPDKRGSLSFEALKQGIDFSSPSMEVLDTYRCLPIEGCFVYIENLLFSATTLMNTLSKTFWKYCSFYNSIFCFILRFCVTATSSFPSWTNTFCSYQLFLCSFLTLSAFVELKRAGALLWKKLWFYGNVAAGLTSLDH